MKSFSASASRTLTLLTIIISLIVAIFIPVGYFMITYRYLEGAADAEMALSARVVERLIADNPNSWYFEEVRMKEILENYLNHDGPEIRTIRDMEGRILARIEEPLTGPKLTHSLPVFDSGTQVARIEVVRSIFPLIVRTALVSAGSILIGIMIFLIFRFLPLRAVREAYRAVEESEERLQFALTAGQFGVCDWDLNRNVMTWDDRMYEIFGTQRDSTKAVVEAWKEGIHPEDRERVQEDARAGGLGEKGYHAEYRVLGPHGAVRYIRADGIVTKKRDGDSLRMIGLHSDITERRLAENMISSLLAEKDLLLKEVHHRIKNNMNNIMALLSFQSIGLKDPSAVSSLEDARNRVQSMMVLYDKLYRSADFRAISTKQYLTSLIDEILRNFPNRQPVSVETRIDDLILEPEIMSPVGMILNELLTNILKHAFIGKESGAAIRVLLSAKDNHAILTVEDNGIGLPESIDIEDPPGFGLQLVGILTRQLDGTIRPERRNGSGFILEFDVQPPAYSISEPTTPGCTK
jgi:PAS domain S-box-containing protein